MRVRFIVRWLLVVFSDSRRRARSQQMHLVICLVVAVAAAVRCDVTAARCVVSAKLVHRFGAVRARTCTAPESDARTHARTDERTQTNGTQSEIDFA